MAALAALAGCLQAGSATAAFFTLPSPTQPVPGPPPLGPVTASQQTPPETEIPIPGHVDSRVLVDVGIGPDGAPVAVTATQRLRVRGTGDYSVVVPAPATSVVPGPGSESLPGLRDVGIVWQGFSNRHRVLSATVTLRQANAAAGLPLRVQVERHADSTVVRLLNLAHRQVSIGTGRTTRVQLVAVLEKLRASYLRPGAVSLLLAGTVGTNTNVDVAAPLHVTGLISQGRSRTTVDELLGA
ncbi:MAG: hypothetical protein QOG68_2550, partial [Solirubrobacteraceae bacterium]|nr:hypothetical protein [Solirubrobacteraceae bacterium]